LFLRKLYRVTYKNYSDYFSPTLNTHLSVRTKTRAYMATDDNPRQALSRSFNTSETDQLKRFACDDPQLDNFKPNHASRNPKISSAAAALPVAVQLEAQSQAFHVRLASSASTNTQSPSVISVCSPTSSSVSSSPSDAKVPVQPAHYALPVQSDCQPVTQRQVEHSLPTPAKLPSNSHKFGDRRTFMPYTYTVASAVSSHTPRSPPSRGPLPASSSLLQPTVAQAVFPTPFPSNGNMFASVYPYQWPYSLGAIPVTAWPAPYASYRIPLPAVPMDQRFPSSLLPYNMDPAAFPNPFYNPMAPLNYGFSNFSPANAFSLQAQRAAHQNFALATVTPRSHTEDPSGALRPDPAYISTGVPEQPKQRPRKSFKPNEDADQDDNNSIPPAGITLNFAAAANNPPGSPDDESTSNDDAATHNKIDRVASKLKRRHASLREADLEDPADPAPQRFKTLIDAVQRQKEVAEAASPVREKRQRRKKPRDPSKGPKLPLSGYLFYVSEQRQMMAKTEEYAEHTFTEVARIIGERWKNLSKQERKPYEAKADLDKARYEREKYQFLFRATAHPAANSNFGGTPENTSDLGSLSSLPLSTSSMSSKAATVTAKAASDEEPPEAQDSIDGR